MNLTYKLKNVNAFFKKLLAVFLVMNITWEMGEKNPFNLKQFVNVEYTGGTS